MYIDLVFFKSEYYSKKKLKNKELKVERRTLEKNKNLQIKTKANGLIEPSTNWSFEIGPCNLTTVVAAKELDMKPNSIKSL